MYSAEADLSEVAVFTLLYALQIRKEEYRTCALKQLLDSDKDNFDARQWAAASLANAYQSTKDRELLRIFFTLLDDDESGDLLKISFVGDVLRVWGVSTQERLARDGFNLLLKELLHEFDPEIRAARKMIVS